MPGLYLPGDRLRHEFQDAIQAQAGELKPFNLPWGPPPPTPQNRVSSRPTGVIVVAEEQPGIYRCETPFGHAVLVHEELLTPIPGISIAGPGPRGGVPAMPADLVAGLHTDILNVRR
jgi:hypothetical protein